MNRLNSVRKLALRISTKYNATPPVNIYEIIKKENIVLEHQKIKFGIDGYTVLNSNPPIIRLNTENTFEPRKRFTLAHELGHIIIPWHNGYDSCNLDDPYIKIQGKRYLDTQELEANIFASEILMPTNWLRQIISKYSDDIGTLINIIQSYADSSIMACLYALENAFDSGYYYYVRKENMEPAFRM